ncbi:MAG: zinc-finger domain-containing protein [Pseudomonadota bacterium]
MTQAPPETEVVTQTRIACDGGTLGHPRVWLQIDPQSGFVKCGYCDKRYVLKGGPADPGVLMTGTL